MRYIINKNFVMTKYENESVLVPIFNNVSDIDNIHVLNKTATIIYEMINDGLCTDQIVSAFSQKTNIDIARLSSDIASVIDKMLSNGIISYIA